MDTEAWIQQQVRQLDPARRVKSADGLHDLLLRLGDLSEREIAIRTEPQAGDAAGEIAADGTADDGRMADLGADYAASGGGAR